MYFKVITLCFIYACLPMETKSQHRQHDKGQHGIYVPPSHHNSDHTYTQTYCGDRYTMYTMLRANWMEAHLQCLKVGMQLTDVNTEREFDFFNNFIKKSRVSKFEKFWTSGNDLFREGNFTWLTTGKAVKFFPATRPVHFGSFGRSENCISLNYNLPMFMFGSANCNDRMLFVCKKKGTSPHLSFGC